MKNRENPCLYIVIPCYNEEAVLPVMIPVFEGKIRALMQNGAVSQESKILFVDDGSKDRTWNIIEDASADGICCGIRLSRNRGHQNALLAGLMEVKDLCDISISIDCDGQDDLNAMDEMIAAYYAGSEIVYGVRNNRKKDTWFKRFTAESFYKVMKWLGADTVYNHADYRLVSSKVLNAFANFREVNIYLRGMMPLVGFNSSCVYYEREERAAGQSHYPLKKMIALAADGITSLSIKPIRIITGLGIIISVVSLLLIVYALVSVQIGTAVPGWASSIVAACFLGGIQLFSLGVIGEYVGKIYLEVKARPRYIVSERVMKDDEVKK